MGPCKLWTGPQFPNGYGRWNVGHRSCLAHRETYRRNHGDIPHGLVVRHRCDNRLCVRLSHLLLGTQHDNMQDMVERGRARQNMPTGTQNPNYRHGHCCNTLKEFRAYRAAYRRQRRATGKE